MKCEQCKKRMKTEPGSADVQLDGKTVRVVNMPILVCPPCGRRELHDIIIGRARVYAAQYGIDENKGTLDFAACEEKEAGDTIVTQMLLNM